MTPKLKNIFWDYNFTEEELNDLLYGRIQHVGNLTRSDMLTRMLEYLNWFDIVKLINKDLFLKNFTPEFIKTLKEQDLQQGLTFVREFLLGKTLSSTR